MTTVLHHTESTGTRPGHIFVLLAGAGTTALTLLGIFLLDVAAPDVNPMGWYLNYVIPVGAILVGLIAGLGYGITSFMMGYKIGKWLLVSILTLQVIAYFAAQFLVFRGMGLVYEETGEPVAFTTWFHFTTISIAFKKTGGQEGGALGAWGYGVRALEIIGFALGGLIVPAVLMGKSYCEKCQRYMKTKELGLIPASIPAEKIKKKDTEGLARHAADQEQAMASATAQLERMYALADAADIAGFAAEFAPHIADKKAVGKLPARLRLDLVYCPTCDSGSLRATLTTGHGENAKVEVLPSRPAPAAFVSRMTLRR